MESLINSIDVFKKEVNCFFENEKYTVRDNGAILRHSRENNRPRKLDNEWTFGKFDPKNGYMKIASVRVHRIVATAFHGKPPDDTYVVDHIDTNRQNNRPENLRWLTRLENGLKNPITQKRIEIVAGVSINEFLANPEKYRDLFIEPIHKFFGNVNEEDNEECLKRIKYWAESEEKPFMHWVPWEYIWHGRMNFNRDLLSHEEQMSLTKNSAQHLWFIRSEFPCSPSESLAHKDPIEIYYSKLEIGNFFYRNDYFEAIISDFLIVSKKHLLYVLVERNAIKPWAIIEVSYREGPYVYIHKIIETYSSKENAEKQFRSIENNL
jgi:hypothetical protein